MLSDRDKLDMLADARSDSRRESFRKALALQESRCPSLKEYCDFCESMAHLFSGKPSARQSPGAGTYRL